MNNQNPFTINDVCFYHVSQMGPHVPAPSAEDFDKKLSETDAYLQLLINQVGTLETRIEACEDVASKEKYNVIKVTANAMIEAIKHSIVMLQISKVRCISRLR